MKRLLLSCLILAGCSATTATPIVIYVTPPPATATGALPASGAPTIEQTAPATEGPTAAPSKAYLTFGDGTFIVGSDIVAGTYRTREDSGACYWERLSGFSGDDTIANELTDYVTIVTIASSDAGFKTEDCGTWTNDLSRITESTTTFGPGLFMVNVDIKPGRYRSTGGDGCYWERLKNFGGDGTIDNDFLDGPTVVDIRSTDKGFKSEDCGTWSRIG
jgi:hypothetical protein